MEILTIIKLVGAFTAAGFIIIAYILYGLHNVEQPENSEKSFASVEWVNELYEELGAYGSRLDEFEEQILEGYKGDEFIEKVRSLERQFAELHEFVNRNLKKMSTRAQRAELLEEVANQAREIDETQRELFPQGTTPNGYRRLVRRPR